MPHQATSSFNPPVPLPPSPLARGAAVHPPHTHTHTHRSRHQRLPVGTHIRRHTWRSPSNVPATSAPAHSHATQFIEPARRPNCGALAAPPRSCPHARGHAQCASSIWMTGARKRARTRIAVAAAKIADRTACALAVAPQTVAAQLCGAAAAPEKRTDAGASARRRKEMIYAHVRRVRPSLWQCARAGLKCMGSARQVRPRRRRRQQQVNGRTAARSIDHVRGGGGGDATAVRQLQLQH